MLKLKLALIGLAVYTLVLAAGGVYVLRLQRAEATLRTERNALATELETTQKRLHASEAALLSLARATENLNTKSKAQNAKTDSALKANPDWAGAGVPPDVLDALRVR